MRCALILSALSVVVLTGCVPTSQVWEKSTAGPGDFERERYACLQQSQQQSSDAYIGRYGGFATSGMTTNGNLFNACMNSRGWNLATKNDEGATPYKVALDAAIAELNEVCSRDEFREIYKKSPCVPTEPSLAHLADHSKITAPEKSLLPKWRMVIRDGNNKVAAIHRQYNPQTGNAIADLIGRGVTDTDTLSLELLNGRITWGEYNKRRRDLNLKSKEDFKNIGRVA